MAKCIKQETLNNTTGSSGHTAVVLIYREEIILCSFSHNFRKRNCLVRHMLVHCSSKLLETANHICTVFWYTCTGNFFAYKTYLYLWIFCNIFKVQVFVVNVQFQKIIAEKKQYKHLTNTKTHSRVCLGLGLSTQ